MSLSIKICKKVGGRLDMIASRTWPQSRMTIGRGEECTLVLEDPKKHVSRVHVELEEKDPGTYNLIVVSKVNPVFINGKRQPPGARLDLQAGDRFELGEYEIEMLAPPTHGKAETPVLDVEETTRPNNPVQAPRPSAPPPPPPPEPKAAPKPEPKPEPKPAPAENPAVFEEATFIGKAMVPPAPPATPPAAAAEEHHDPIDHASLPPVEPGIFDDHHEPEKPAAAPAKPAAPAKDKDSTDVFAEATFMGGTSAPATGNVFDEATYVGGRHPAAGAAAAAAGGGDPAAVQKAIKAFLEGAGLADKAVSNSEAEEFLRQSGKIVRAAVEGAMALLAARATAKKELRAEDRTMVASKDNNPLKLMSDPQEVLSFLFDTKDRTGGFLDPVQAVGDAFADLKAHEVALFAAMRAALAGAIQRFDPKTLEAELEKGAGSLGLNRKAKLWELFAAYQQKLARDSEDDFNKVFGREFMGTYTAQVKRLKSGG
jgi:type VI secretion system FHA domain protein